MHISRKILISITFSAAALSGEPARAQIDLPASALPVPNAFPDSAVASATAPFTLRADLDERILYVQRGDSTIKTYAIAVGQDRYPTPRGSFTIKKIIWNPSWHPPPDADWAKGKKEKGPGDPGNPMRVVKILFQEPDYYIHGTGDVESLGSAASHGCLRMDPQQIADLAKLIMEHGGQPREENWFWRIIHSWRHEKVVYLDNPIPLIISGS